MPKLEHSFHSLFTSDRRPFISTSLLLSANSMGKITAYDTCEGEAELLLETQLEEMDEIHFLEQIDGDRLAVCSGESTFRIYKISIVAG